VAAWWLCRLPMVELVFVVVCRPGVLVLSPEKAAVEEVERERKKNRESCRNREEADFLAYFGPKFLLPQAIKSTSIYSRWKRAIFSTQGKNFQPLIRLGRIQRLAQNRHGTLSNLQKKLPVLACLGHRRRRLIVIQTELLI